MPIVIKPICDTVKMQSNGTEQLLKWPVSKLTYKHAPITEAVIELRFDGKASDAVLEKAAKKAAPHYPLLEDDTGVNVSFDVGRNSSKIDIEWRGKKLSNYDRTEVCIYRTNGMIVARLAPYQGWDEFIARAQRDWATWKKAADFTRVSRIGVRYINRLDIPQSSIEPININDYLSIYPSVPKFSDMPLENYILQMQERLPEDACRLTINTGSVPSPLLKHFSFLLDIDIAKDTDIPQRDEDIWDIVSRFRGYKNSVFEACITELSRALFNK